MIAGHVFHVRYLAYRNGRHDHTTEGSFYAVLADREDPWSLIMVHCERVLLFQARESDRHCIALQPLRLVSIERVCELFAR